MVSCFSFEFLLPMLTVNVDFCVMLLLHTNFPLVTVRNNITGSHVAREMQAAATATTGHNRGTGRRLLL